jgi:hypothetical protein
MFSLFRNNQLLSFRWKWTGGLLVLSGLAGLVFYVWFDFRLMIPVFAILSSFFETKTFSVIRTNAADELIMLSLITGFFLLAFSKEKSETERLAELRIRSWGRAIRVNTALLVFSVLFFYGNAFLTILLVNLISCFIFYLVFFHVSKYKMQNQVH